MEGRGRRVESSAVVEGCCGSDSMAAAAGGGGGGGGLNSSAVAGMNSSAANMTLVAGSVGEQLSANLIWAIGIGMLSSQCSYHTTQHRPPQTTLCALTSQPLTDSFTCCVCVLRLASLFFSCVSGSRAGSHVQAVRERSVEGG